LFKGSIIVHGHTYSYERLIGAVGAGSLLGIKVTLAASVTELLSVGWKASSIRHMFAIRSSSWRTDVGVTIMDTVHLSRILARVMSFGLAFVSFNWLRDLLTGATGIQFTLGNLPTVPQFLLGFFAYTFFDYWDHRLAHTRVLWPLHRFHHAATEFYVFTSQRVHPADISGIFVIVAPLVLLGISPDILFALTVFRVYLGSIQHSKIQSDWGWFGRWFIYSPTGHRLHHLLLADDTQTTCNFGLIPLWDHLFGTWHGGGNQQLPIGVNTPYRHGAWFFPDLWRDYCEFLGECRSEVLRLCGNRFNLLK